MMNTTNAAANNNRTVTVADTVVRTRGEKYETTRELDITAIAKLVRADIKAAIKAGKIPAVKTSVRIDRFSMGQSLDIKVTAVPAGFEVVSREYMIDLHENPHPSREIDRHPASATAVLEVLESILSAYNRSESCHHTDLNNKRFFGDASFGWELVRDEEKRIAAELAAERAAAPVAAPAPRECTDMVDYLETLGQL